MKSFLKLACGLFTLAVFTQSSHAVTITLEKNGFADLFGGQITGTGLGSPVPLGATTNAVSFTGVAGGSYHVDFFHNSGVGGSDFSFTVNGGGTGVGTVGLGGGQHTMVAGFTAGDTTLTLNSQSVTYNANGGQKGNYYLAGISSPSGLNSPPLTRTIIPGWVSADNLYSTGLNAEDYIFTVDSAGAVSAYTNNGLHNAEFATFSGSSVSPRSARVYYTVRASTNLCCAGVSSPFPAENFTSIFDVGSELPYVYRFTMDQAIGNSGALVFEYGSNTVVAGNAMLPTGYGFTIFDSGPSLVGQTLVNDFLMNARLRFTNDLSAPFAINGYYFMNTDGNAPNVGALVVGFKDGNTIPLTVSFDVALPEPTSRAIFALGTLALWLMRFRQR